VIARGHHRRDTFWRPNMSPHAASIAVVLLTLVPWLTAALAEDSAPRFALAIHGGAGTITPEQMTPDLEQQYRAKLGEALAIGRDILQRGGSSLDACEAVVRLLEDSPLFNAGKGSVFTAEGTNEMDAAIMDGSTRRAGAIAGVKHVKNPITLARLVMEHSPHVMLTGDGAEAFAKENGIELVSPEYFFTERRWRELERARAKEKEKPASPAGEREHGTVGAVALDRQGHLAAATSTGGMTNKKFGRVGDSPIIGAGTYASDRSCAVSATGNGEYFIRAVVAHDVAARIEYQGLPLARAAEAVLNEVTALGGTGGFIALDKNGEVAMPFNTSGMYRGYVKADGPAVIAIYKE
jgi:beta-aspartyl-peptidase (threonine type)